MALGTALSIIGALGSLATGIGSLVGGGGGSSKPKIPAVPKGKATQPDVSNFAQQRKAGSMAGEAPIKFGEGLTSIQQRSQIATGGTAGNTGIYQTPEVQRFYKDLAFRTLTDEAGNPSGSPLPVERQFAEQTFGVTPKNPSTASFLSALLRS